jgi:hypothetical protein
MFRVNSSSGYETFPANGDDDDGRRVIVAGEPKMKLDEIKWVVG